MFTGYGWVGQLLVEDRARVSYSLNGARGNTEMESFNSRFTPALAGGARETEKRSLLLDVHTPQDLERLGGRGCDTTTENGDTQPLDSEHPQLTSRLSGSGRSITNPDA